MENIYGGIKNSRQYSGNNDYIKAIIENGVLWQYELDYFDHW